MNENIDLTKILKDCPRGFKLYSTICGEVLFDLVISNNSIGVTCDGRKIYFSKEGYYFSHNNQECLLLPSKDQRDWNKFSAPWYKKEREKFDPKTLQQYDKVIGRDSNDDIWECSLFSHIREHESFPYRCVGTSFVYCIPYNDDTKHLVGTTDEAPEYYEYWED